MVDGGIGPVARAPSHPGQHIMTVHVLIINYHIGRPQSRMDES
jgi:hypothetical protein